MSNARQGWNAAQLASERPLSERKSHAPVGTPVVIDWGGGTVDVVHKCCGYHVCSCVSHWTVREQKWTETQRVLKEKYEAYLTSVTEGKTTAWKCGSVDPCCCDKCWAEPEPTEPALLTYDQAVAACRAGATLQITGGVQEDAKEWIGAHLRFVHGFFQTNLKGRPWTFCRIEDNGVQFRIVP